MWNMFPRMVSVPLMPCFGVARVLKYVGFESRLIVEECTFSSNKQGVQKGSSMSPFSTHIASVSVSSLVVFAKLPLLLQATVSVTGLDEAKARSAVISRVEGCSRLRRQELCSETRFFL